MLSKINKCDCSREKKQVRNFPLDKGHFITGIETGDRVTFIVDGTNVRVVNSAVYALLKFQEEMKGEGEKAGLLSEESVSEWITKSRREDNSK